MGNTRTGSREADRDRKRKECEARTAEWQARSPREQLHHLNNLNLGAGKQRARLAKKGVA